MARKINQLTPLKVEQLVRKTKTACMFADGLGLYLMVRRPGAGAWAFRYKIAGKTKLQGLGPVHTVSLAEARNRAAEARKLILDGRDPLAVKAEAKAAAQIEAARTLTFEQACQQFLATGKIQKLKDKASWSRTLPYLFPTIGTLPLEQIDSAIMLQALLPVMKRTGETGTRLRGRVERVFAWAKAHKLFTGENPASRDVLRDALPAKPKAVHHRAMPYAELPGFMGKLIDRDSSVSAKALAFTILCAARTAETIGARWSEIDVKAATWTIPGERMKAGKPHIVPLSDAALAILKAMPRVGDHVFINGGGRPISNMAMLQLMKGMGANGVPHGFRSSFSDWALDRTAFAPDVIEHALAHTIKNKVAAAYRRETALDKRQRLMAEWARFCDGGTADLGATVTPIRAS